MGTGHAIMADIKLLVQLARSSAPGPRGNGKATKKLKNSLKSVGELVLSAPEQPAQSSDYQTDH